MITFHPLASGSKGNCIYLKTPQLQLLIDAGISGRATVRKLEEIGVSIDEIDAIIITHDHTDHIQGLRTLAFRYGVPVLANAETAKGIIEMLGKSPAFKIFSTGETFELKDCKIHPYSIQHDTLDPVAFTIECEKHKIGICTDLGFVTSLVKHHLQECSLLYLEANHEPHMVQACIRPMVYKQRVLGRCGHLSNQACAELLRDVAHSNLERVYLAHLSGECNTPEAALGIVGEMADKYSVGVDIQIAYQDEISEPTRLN